MILTTKQNTNEYIRTVALSNKSAVSSARRNLQIDIQLTKIIYYPAGITADDISM